MLNNKPHKTVYITIFSLIFYLASCGSSDDDDFRRTLNLEQRKEILKQLFTEAMYNTITAESRNNVACKESNRAELLPEDVQNLPNGQWYYTYENLITGMAEMEDFATESDDENINKLEIAAFLANIAQETGAGIQADPLYGGPGCFIQEGSGSKRNSCEYGGCVNTPGYDDTITCKNNNYTCPAGDLGWSGRGPHQLSWAANYASYGSAMGVGDKYRNDPDQLTISPNIGIAGSVWFWGYTEKSSSYPDNIPFKPSAHDVIVGKWSPTEHDINCGRTTANLGIITNIINGGIECGPESSQDGRINAQKRVTFFNNIANVLGVTIPSDWAVNCDNQQNFAACPSYLKKSSRCGTSWAEANNKCGTLCSSNNQCSNGEICWADLSETPCN
jgi:basic endochitinase B